MTQTLMETALPPHVLLLVDEVDQVCATNGIRRDELVMACTLMLRCLFVDATEAPEQRTVVQLFLSNAGRPIAPLDGLLWDRLKEYCEREPPRPALRLV